MPAVTPTSAVRSTLQNQKAHGPASRRGFRHSTPEQAAKVAFRADAVVVGSAIVWRMDEHGKDPAFVRQITGFVRPLAEAIHGTRR